MVAFFSKSPYRSFQTFENEVRFKDFIDYFYDARAIGFSKRKAMNYAWNCCNSDIEESRLMVVSCLENSRV